MIDFSTRHLPEIAYVVGLRFEWSGGGGGGAGFLKVSSSSELARLNACWKSSSDRAVVVSCWTRCEISVWLS